MNRDSTEISRHILPSDWRGLLVKFTAETKSGQYPIFFIYGLFNYAFGDDGMIELERIGKEAAIA
jgi:hypothetical protein